MSGQPDPDCSPPPSTAARIINHDASGVRQLNMAYEQGLGEVSEDRIEMVGERLDDLRVDWTPAELAEPTDLGKWGYHRHGTAFA